MMSWTASEKSLRTVIIILKKQSKWKSSLISNKMHRIEKEIARLFSLFVYSFKHQQWVNCKRAPGVKHIVYYFDRAFETLNLIKYLCFIFTYLVTYVITNTDYCPVSSIFKLVIHLLLLYGLLNLFCSSWHTICVDDLFQKLIPFVLHFWPPYWEKAYKKY